MGMRQVTFSNEFMGQVLQGLTHAAQAVEQKSRKLAEEQESLRKEEAVLRDTVEQYSKDRITHVKEELALRELTWCTCCNCVVSEHEVRLQLVQGRRSRKWGDDGYYFRDYADFHRVCPACYAQEEARCYVGEYDALAQDRAFHKVFPVQKRDDGYYSFKDGTYVKMAAACQLPDIAPQTIEQLARDWGLVPGVGIVDGKFIVYEQAPTSETA